MSRFQRLYKIIDNTRIRDEDSSESNKNGGNGQQKKEWIDIPFLHWEMDPVASSLLKKPECGNIGLEHADLSKGYSAIDSFDDIVSAKMLTKARKHSISAANVHPLVSLRWSASVLRKVPHQPNSTTNERPRIAFYGGVSSNPSRNGELLSVITQIASRDVELPSGASSHRDVEANASWAQLTTYNYDDLTTFSNVSGGKRSNPGKCQSFMPTLDFLKNESSDVATTSICKYNRLAFPLSTVTSLSTCGNRGLCGVATSDGKFAVYDVEDAEDDDDEFSDAEEESDDDDSV